MEITTSSNTLTIEGNIKSVSDHQEIKNSLNAMLGSTQEVNIIIKDSLSITSSVIGYLNKLVLKDGIKINMIVGNQMLLDLLDELNLTSVFHTRRM